MKRTRSPLVTRPSSRFAARKRKNCLLESSELVFRKQLGKAKVLKCRKIGSKVQMFPLGARKPSTPSSLEGALCWRCWQCSGGELLKGQILLLANAGGEKGLQKQESQTFPRLIYFWRARRLICVVFLFAERRAYRPADGPTGWLCFDGSICRLMECPAEPGGQGCSSCPRPIRSFTTFIICSSDR